jgi:hypothetical protein
MDDPVIDGILFPSVQSGYAGQNVALFHKASLVDEIDLPEGTTLKADTWQMYNEGPEREYKVVETVPDISDDETEEHEPETSILDLWQIDEHDLQPSGNRPISLRIDIDDLQVRLVKQTSYDTENHSVLRMRFVDREPPF